jgi:hypothetical protein
MILTFLFTGGAEGARTPDLMTASRLNRSMILIGYNSIKDLWVLNYIKLCHVTLVNAPYTHPVKCET